MGKWRCDRWGKRWTRAAAAVGRGSVPATERKSATACVTSASSVCWMLEGGCEMRCLAVPVTAFVMWLMARKGEAEGGSGDQRSRTWARKEASMGSQAGIENLRLLVGAVEMKRIETGE